MVETFKLGTAKLDEILKGKENFVFWKLKLERYLRIQDTAEENYYYLHVTVDAQPANLDANARGRYNRSQARSLNLILNSISQNIYLEISHIDNAKAIMEYLSLKYKPTVLDAVKIRGELSSLKIGTSANSYIDAISAKISMLKSMQFAISNEEHKAYLLGGLDSKYISCRTQAVINPGMETSLLENLIREESTTLQEASIPLPEANFTKKKRKQCKHCPTMSNDPKSAEKNASIVMAITGQRLALKQNQLTQPSQKKTLNQKTTKCSP